MLIELTDNQYDALLHDLRDIAFYLKKTSEYFDEEGMKNCYIRLIQIKEELRQCTDTKD